MQPVCFPAPADLRRWFAKHHATARELWAGFYKISFEREERGGAAGKRLVYESLTFNIVVDDIDH